MLKYVLKQCKNEKSSAYQKWYAFPVMDQTMDLKALAKHMEEHNSGYAEHTCVGVMMAMVKCIKEMILEGKNVKIDDLAIFSCGIRNKMGAATEAEFTTSGNIAGVKLRARATGTLSSAQLNLQASLKKTTLVASSGNGGTSGGAGGSGDEEEVPFG